MVREVVNIHIGQAGIQMANAAWEIFCLEHGVSRNGTISNEISSDEEYVARQTFFEETESNLHVPRAVFIDTEPTVIDEIRQGPYRNLFNKCRLFSGQEDAANNFARGYFHLGREKIDDIMNRIRCTMEACDELQGVLITHGYGGGTGSGLCCLVTEKLTNMSSKMTKIQLSVYPSMSLATAVVEPYNCTLLRHFSDTHCDVCLLMDNEAMYDICTNRLDVELPKYKHLNQVIAQIMSSATITFRYGGTVNTDFNQIVTNLIPYPRLNYPLLRFAPLFSRYKASSQKITGSSITKESFSRNNQTIKCDTSRGLYMSVVLSYRGHVCLKEITSTINQIRDQAADVRFVDWCPTGFKIGQCDRISTMPTAWDIAPAETSVLMMGNTSAVGQTFTQLKCKFDLLIRKRAFLHWYVSEGLELEQMNDAGLSLDETRRDYFEAGMPTTLTEDDNNGYE